MYHCVGCGASVPWDGVSIFSYTCSCKATIFICDSNGAPCLPSSILMSILRKRTVRVHLDDLVGTSDHTSDEKTIMINYLTERGCGWMKDCPQCQRDGTLTKRDSRTEMEFQLQQVRNRAATGELTSEEAVAESMAVHKRHSSGK